LAPAKCIAPRMSAALSEFSCSNNCAIARVRSTGFDEAAALARVGKSVLETEFPPDSGRASSLFARCPLLPWPPRIDEPVDWLFNADVWEPESEAVLAGFWVPK